ncbi:MAG: c-type cytochrome [Bryobacterales bacterium]|nr:c-type cytochrome [Bryobacterales bacterium]
MAIVLLVLTLCLNAFALAAESGKGAAVKPESGEGIYRAACTACHGPNGKGVSRSVVGFENPLPDFTDCNFGPREANNDWAAVVTHGGPARGFSRIMPAFHPALTAEEIDRVVEYLRGFCREPAWPRGELNLPRALVTEKAFPEDEAVVTTSINATEGSAVSQKVVYERRFGARNQFEAVLPYGFAGRNGAGWGGGIGDIALGYKRVLFHSLRHGSIFSLTGEAVLPTGDRARGFGKGVTVFEPFASYGQILPGDSFLQFQGGVELPTHTDDASRAGFWRVAAGKTFTQGGGFGRAWSPMVELLADRDFEPGARTNWDVAPQLQVTLSTRQHIMANFGVRIPATHTAGRPVQIMFYLLWDWFDGGLRDGW